MMQVLRDRADILTRMIQVIKDIDLGFTKMQTYANLYLPTEAKRIRKQMVNFYTQVIIFSVHSRRLIQTSKLFWRFQYYPFTSADEKIHLDPPFPFGQTSDHLTRTMDKVRRSVIDLDEMARLADMNIQHRKLDGKTCLFVHNFPSNLLNMQSCWTDPNLKNALQETRSYQRPSVERLWKKRWLMYHVINGPNSNERFRSY